MSMIISFAWTTDAFLAGRKSRTRREWDNEYAARFNIRDVCIAYNKQPRFGGKRIGTIRITGIKKESILLMPDSDFEKEGFAYMRENGIKIWNKEAHQAFVEWRASGGDYWVIDFKRIT